MADAKDSNNDGVSLEIKSKEIAIEAARSRVRRWVTYVSIYGYIVIAGIVVLWLMWAGRYEVAIGVLSGIAGLAGSISGYWFGSRRPKSSGS